MKQGVFGISRLTATIVMAACILSGCMKWDYGDQEDFSESGRGLFIINEGNFQYGNATISYYSTAKQSVENEVFYRANGMRLGDVAQSMTVYDDKGWIVVNNSHAVFAIDLETFKEAGRIEGLPNPRYIHFVDDDKAYVTQLWDNHIYIINPKRYEVTGLITVPDMVPESGSTEEMVQIGQYVYCTCWSYQNCIIKIDTSTDQVVDRLTLGVQPKSIVLDRYGRLWTFTDGGYNGNPTGYEAPALYCIDPASFDVVRRFRFRLGDRVSGLCINGTRDRIYWINEHVWDMDVSSTRLPVKPLIDSRGTIYYGLTVDPVTDDIYVADAIDYQQQGIIYHYSSSAKLIDDFYVGVNPGAFCWK